MTPDIHTGVTNKNSKDTRWAENMNRKYNVASCRMESKMLGTDECPIILDLHTVNTMIANERDSVASRYGVTSGIGHVRLRNGSCGGFRDVPKNIMRE